MEAEKVPEKIYLYETKINNIISYRGITLEGRDNDIEYIRKDAFIDKVCDWLSDTLQTVVDVNIPSAHHVESIPALGIITQTEFIEKFKKEIIFLLD